MKNYKRIIALILVLVSITSLFASCGNKEQVINAPTLIPEEQIMADKYALNDDITNMVKFTMDYTKTRREDGKTSINEKITTYALSEHFGIQVDNWKSIVIGIDTMGDILAEIDARNAQYVEEQTAALIAARQKAIDEEYEKAKAEAEANGKTYTKEKKSVRTDDIHFDNPYTYTLAIGTDKKKAAEPYQETLLIDPAKNSKIVVKVCKYGLPYVTLTFAKVNKLYNFRITQESDWIVTAIQAADVSEYMYETVEGSKKKQLKEKMPEFVDVDGLNKAAKQNMFMNGNISFGGGNFNWESLMKFCKALGLVEGSKKHGFTQSSDKQFTYYTIYFAANPFEKEHVNVYDDEVQVPWIKLVATFDPLSQVCVNWTLDMSTAPTSLKNKVHTLSSTFKVNVKDYQVDTNDYEGMRQDISKWVDSHKSTYKVAYCAQENNAENNVIFGIVETGTKNTAVEIVIDGKTYIAQSGGEWKNGGCFGYYLDAEKLNEANAAATQEEAQKIIDKNKKALTIGCYVLDASNNIVCAFDPTSIMFTTASGAPVYLVSYEETDSGYRNARLLDSDTTDELITLYAKTYRLSEQQVETMHEKFAVGGVPGVKKYVDDLFAEAEAAQKEQQDNMSGSNKNTSASKLEPNTTEDLSEFTYNGKTYTLDSISYDVFASAFTTDKVYSLVSSLINVNGVAHMRGEDDNVIFVTDESNGRQYVFGTRASDIEFFDGIHAGMSVSDLKKKMGAAYDSELTAGIFKSKTHTLIALVVDEVVETVFVIDNDYYNTKVEMEISPIIMEELQKHQPLVTTVNKNTTEDISKIKINMAEHNFLTMSKKYLSDIGYQSQIANQFALVDNYVHLFGYSFVNSAKSTIRALPHGDGLQFIYVTNDNDINQPEMEFYNGIRVGISKKELISLLPEGYFVDETAGRYVVNNGEVTMVVSCESVVSYIVLMKNDTYKAS